MSLTLPPQAVLVKIAAYVLGALALFYSGYFVGRHSVQKADAVAVAKDTVNNVKEVTHANDVKEEVVRTVIKYVHDKPLGSVSLCVPPSSEQAPAPGIDQSVAGDVAPAVHDGDSGVRPEEAGPDIADLLSAYAAVFAVENADLAAEQSVK